MKRAGGLGAAAAAACVAAFLGHAAARFDEARLAREIERLERSNAQLSANADALAEALRAARSPLQHRIAALEARLAGPARAAEPEPPGPAPGPRPIARAEAVEPAHPPAGTAAPAAPPAPSLASTRESAPDPAPAPEAPDVAPVPEPAPRKAAAASGPDRSPAKATSGLPAVAAAPPVPSPDPEPPAVAPGPDPACRALSDPEFALVGIGDATERLSGRLRLSLSRSEETLLLHLAGDGASPYSLHELPLHVSFDCDGIDYIVSVCRALDNPVAVRGAVSHAARWSRPCRGLDSARSGAAPPSPDLAEGVSAQAATAFAR
jgi:hypothetical protein